MHILFISFLFLVAAAPVAMGNLMPCPPKDSWACSLILDGQKKDLFVVYRGEEQAFKVKNGKMRGSVMVVPEGASIDGDIDSGSGMIYEMKVEDERTEYKFVEVNGINENSDLRKMLSKNKKGVLVIRRKTGAHTYQFAKGPKVPTFCTEKYFVQLNPHHTQAGPLSDADACKLLQRDREAQAAPLPSPAPTNKSAR